MSEHTHHHTETKNVLNRLSRATGHLEAIKKPSRRWWRKAVTEGDVLIQLAAVCSAINSIGKIILANHMEHCIAVAIEKGEREALDQYNDAIAIFLK